MAATAIQTRYAGCHFRSRLEARWAVFFDAMKIPWHYEIEGYLVGVNEQSRYLPDFWLPQTQTWVEVKGDPHSADWQLLADAVDWGSGLPGTENSHLTTRGILLLGDLPRPPRVGRTNRETFFGPFPPASTWSPCYPILQHHEGGYVNRATFDWSVEDAFTSGPDIPGPGQMRIHRGTTFFDSTWGGQDAEEWVSEAAQLIHGTRGYKIPQHFKVSAAFERARSARFEHGARP